MEAMKLPYDFFGQLNRHSQLLATTSSCSHLTVALAFDLSVCAGLKTY